MQLRLLVAHCHLTLGRFAAAGGEAADARSALTGAAATFEAIGAGLYADTARSLLSGLR
jgi:hypothetical protein